jgi:hypothetical protein
MLHRLALAPQQVKTPPRAVFDNHVAYAKLGITLRPGDDGRGRHGFQMLEYAQDLNLPLCGIAEAEREQVRVVKMIRDRLVAAAFRDNQAGRRQSVGFTDPLNVVSRKPLPEIVSRSADPLRDLLSQARRPRAEPPGLPKASIALNSTSGLARSAPASG